jgi:FkbM family methyltransferase
MHFTRKYGYYLKSIFQLITEFGPFGRIIGLFTGLASKDTYQVKLRRWELVFRVRSAMDVWSVKETFVDRFYELYGTSLGDGWVVVDIGGGIGDFTIFAAYRHPTNSIYAFEPYPGSFTLLSENLKLNQTLNVQVFQQAIWSNSGALSLDTTTGEPVQFISREIDAQAANGNLAVPCDSLENTLKSLGIERCDLLKIDAEGAEYTILFNTPDQTLDRIRRIVMEYHDAITTYTHADLSRFLSEKGFRVTTVENAVHPDLGYLYAERPSTDEPA